MTITVWKLDHYEPETGKTVGIWPGSYDQAVLDEYKEKYGFNKLRIYSTTDRTRANIAGFSDLELVVQIPHEYNQYQQKINEFPTVTDFYLDEPIERGTYSVPQIGEVNSYIAANRPGATFTIGGWGYSFLFSLNYGMSYLYAYSQYPDFDMAYTGYGNLIEPDQRSIWTDMNTTYGSDYNFVWVHSALDYGEFIQLMGHAQNLGINDVRCYIGSNGEPNNVDEFCLEAYTHNYLKRFMHKYIYNYKCYLPDPCSNCDPQNMEIWYLENIIDTREVLEL